MVSLVYYALYVMTLSFYVLFVDAGRMMRQVAQSSTNYGWGCGKISVANDAKVNFKGDSHGSEEKSKEKSS
jgi:hypothetical protein